MAWRFAGAAGGIAAGCDRKMPRGAAGRRGLWAARETRRDADCGERDGRDVEGQQGHEPGGTIDADDVRPLHQNGAVTSRFNRNL